MLPIRPQPPAHLANPQSQGQPPDKTQTGPQLPPHHRPSQPKEAKQKDTESSSNSPRAVGPTLPSQPQKRLLEETDPSPPKRARIGPSLPPHLATNTQDADDRRPSHTPASASASDSDSEDDYGPSLNPTSSTSQPEGRSQHWDKHAPLDPQPADNGPRKRDEWMMLPPQADDLGRMDPLKQQARGFSMKKSSRGKGDVGGMWTETGEEKRKRLEDEVMGVSSARPSAGPSRTEKEEISRRRRENAPQMEEEEEDKGQKKEKRKSDSKSLYEQHKRSRPKDEDDDPSMRAFNYEKDMAVGSKMAHKQKRELINSAKNMGGRFSKGSSL